MKKRARRDGNVLDTLVMIAVIAALFVAAYFRIAQSVQQRSLSRLNEGVQTVMEAITEKFERDSRILNATADILASGDLDPTSAIETMESVAPLLDSMNIRLLMPDETVITADGSITDVSDVDNISFAEEAPLGEHVSNRVYSFTGNQPIVRHFVPVVQDGRTVAMLYGVTWLNELPERLNVDVIYNGSASVYVIDTRTGDFLVDTWHEELGNVNLYSQQADPDRETKGAQDWDDYMRDIMALNTGYVIFRADDTDGWEYMYYGPAHINDWSISVSVPEREAFANLFAIRRIFIVIGTLMAAAVTVYYILIRRRMRM